MLPTSGLALIAKEDGLAATMKGLSPRFTRVAMAQAITFTVYEMFLSWYCKPQPKDIIIIEMQAKIDALQAKLNLTEEKLLKRDATIAEMHLRLRVLEG